MFPIVRLYAILAVGAVTLLVAALLVFAGYRVGEQRVRSQWDAERAASADAIAGAAQRDVRDATADIAVRATAEGAVAQRAVEIRREIVKIPVRIGCGHSADEYRVLLDTYCARYPGAPQCLYHALPAAGGTAAVAGQPPAN